MLSRVADSLYWMSRYVERAENVARILDVNLQLMLDLPARRAQALQKNWLPVVACLGDEPSFRQRYRKADSQSVTEFLVFDCSHPNSILGSLAAARENARTVREQLSSEMWEQINSSYLWSASKPARQSFERNQYEFFKSVKERVQLFQGITDTSMVHSEGWEFIQIGKYLERADKTSRVLDDEYYLLLGKSRAPNDELLQWLAILRSCSARQAYQRVYAANVQPVRAAELLLLDESFPRSVRFCLQQLDLSLRRLSGVPPGHYSNPAEKLSGRFLAELSFSSIEEVCQPSLHQAMDQFQIRLNQIGEAIFQTYIHPMTAPPGHVPPAYRVPQE